MQKFEQIMHKISIVSKIDAFENMRMCHNPNDERGRVNENLLLCYRGNQNHDHSREIALLVPSKQKYKDNYRML